MTTSAPIRDRLDRPLRDLRISVTDRCNFRCTYCMPRDEFGPDHEFIPRDALLTYEEIGRAVSVFAMLGVRNLRLTGGEPLLRRDLDVLVRLITRVEGIADVAMTTNGALLAPAAERLRTAGLTRVTVSLDSLDPSTFRHIADTNVPLHRVIDGIDAALTAGLRPVKLNAVIKRGVNDGEICDLAEFARARGCVLRFIEYMDVGTANGWRMGDVVSGREIIERLHESHSLVGLAPAHAGEVAKRFRYQDGRGEVGIVTSITQPFCGDCSRIRLSAQGELFTCLFGHRGHDLRTLLRSGASVPELSRFISSLWASRTDRYSELRAETPVSLPRVEMSYIGG